MSVYPDRDETDPWDSEMQADHERLISRAATIDELLSDRFEPLPGQKSDSDLAARRLAAWCRSSASGDWTLLARRLERDGLSLASVLAKFATVRRNPSRPAPSWMQDAAWIAAALSEDTDDVARTVVSETDRQAFEELLEPVVRQADARLWQGLDPAVGAALGPGVRVGLRRCLVVELSRLAAPALYERFVHARQGDGAPLPSGSTARYDEFIANMRSGGLRRLFDDKPVLLRLMAALTRQWLESSRELLTRLHDDLPAIRRQLLAPGASADIRSIDGSLSDPHNLGRTVRVITFDDDQRVVYKPKDLRVDAAWHSMIDELNPRAPIALKAVRVLACDGYGWAEYVRHPSCADGQGFPRFFRRTGAWLALFYCFAGVDMHQENVIADGDHPVPIDLEMILQADPSPEVSSAADRPGVAVEAAHAAINNSVMTVGLLPVYGSQSNEIFSIGGIASDSKSRSALAWRDINTDAMRPELIAQAEATLPNLPQFGGRYALPGDYVDDLASGFRDYATFLQQQRPEDLFGRFAGLTVRKVLRPTRFYYMLLERLRDHRAMDDGAVWSAQADFTARLSDWERDSDPLWPLQSAERAAIVELNVPHFVMGSDGNEIADAFGTSVATTGPSGRDRACGRLLDLDEAQIARQTEVIEVSTATLRRQVPRLTLAPLNNDGSAGATSEDAFHAAAEAAVKTLSQHAFHGNSDAAWIGLDWLGDNEVSQLVALGHDLYNGTCGIALFLAAHAAVTGSASSRDLAVAALADLRERLHGRNPGRVARLLGLGGGFGLGSIVYGLAVVADLLGDSGLLADAHRIAELVTDELIAADRQLDVLGGSAGAILGLLRLHRQTGSGDALARAIRCGKHLLAQSRVGAPAQRTWLTPGFARPINGMSHGAAGFAYALASLSSVTGSDEFADAARECLAFENASFDAQRGNWPDLRSDPAAWPCKWCHGAPGIGLARAAMTGYAVVPGDVLRTDIGHALTATARAWPAPTDTLCCGTLGSVELLWEASDVLGDHALRDRASQWLLSVVLTARERGTYRWSSGTSQFNLGLFRGVAGAGYTSLRRVAPALPNVLMWE
ncbi:type 2 lanthipeptide synthetase LanM family protein [Mycobacterium camsae]|uniref:type 2 lanthipeptide synthetase LanM family protein n=1 Tax=Mycobacterium gordonae TaxID=1778 RepID=UPI0019818EA1|nr:type 2 lanthipeptide synthetase LanM family protein [Mycobacterium gordonae]